MSKTMLYKFPKTIKSCTVNKGFCKVDRKEYDYIIVDDADIDSCVNSEGWFKTTAEALNNSGFTIENLRGLTIEQIKAKYSREIVNTLAKSLSIKSYASMADNTLITRLMEMVK